MNVPLFQTRAEELGPGSLADYERAVAAALQKDGYAIIDFPDADIEALADDIIATLGRELRGPGAEGERIQKPVRVQDHPYEAVRQIAGNQAVQDLLSQVYGRRAFPFQTLNFSVGTQQPVHSDDVHFSSYPKGFMCGVWVALEDIHPDAGPLEFYAGSHHLNNVDGIAAGQHPLEAPHAQAEEFDGDGTQVPLQGLWQEKLAKAGLAPSYFLGKKGQALIWVYNLLHGGSPRRDLDRTRWSQVTHYYFEGCDYYTPLLSEYEDGSIHYREEIIDLNSGALMSSTPQAVLPADFDAARYLDLNPDVKAAGEDSVHHWLNHGFFEKRRYK